MWPLELRHHCVKRLLSPNPPSVSCLEEETGIPNQTLTRWRSAARNGARTGLEERMASKKDKRPTRWPPAERLRVIEKSAGLSDDELGAFLRREGLHAATVEEWRRDALAGLGGQARGPSGKPKVSRRERELQRELRRKEKALAETAALLVLQKKSRLLFGEDEDD